MRERAQRLSGNPITPKSQLPMARTLPNQRPRGTEHVEFRPRCLARAGAFCPGDHLDALWAVLILWCAGWTVTEAVRVRDGSISRRMVLWPSRKGVKGTHEEFVARYRRALTVMGWSFVALGASNLVFATTGSVRPTP